MVVINKKVRNAVMPMVAIASLMVIDGCNKDEVVPEKDRTDLLVGDWKVSEIDGEPTDALFEYGSFSITLDFKASGDMDFCTEIGFLAFNYEYCYDGKWTWADAEKSKLGLTLDGDALGTADVILLNETNMEWNIDAADYGNNWKFTKIN